MVKLKTKMMKTYNLEHVEHAEKYGSIEQTRSGGYELVFPTKLNEEVKRFMGNKDFEMDIIKEGEDTLWVTLTPKKVGDNKSKKIN
jgi:hypothetical protein